MIDNDLEAVPDITLDLTELAVVDEGYSGTGRQAGSEPKLHLPFHAGNLNEAALEAASN